MHLSRLLLICIISLTSNAVVYADDHQGGLEGVDLSEKLNGLAVDIKTISERNIKRREDTAKEIELLKTLINNHQALSSQQLKKIQELALKISLEKELSMKNEGVYKEVELNFEKYVFQTNAQKIMPIIYSLVALSYADKTDGGEMVLYGLAGYGTGALIENTGYGTAAVITYFKYKF